MGSKISPSCPRAGDLAPTFYDRRADDLPRRWLARMKAALTSLSPVYNTHRRQAAMASGGASNAAFNKPYSDPIALTPLVDAMPEPGRKFFVEFIAHRQRANGDSSTERH